MIGRVLSKKLIKTATVVVERRKVHPFYKKTSVRSKKYLVHDPLGSKMGDIVEFVKVRPISKRKHWVVTKVLGKSLEEITKEGLKEKAAEAIAQVLPQEKKEVHGSTQNNTETGR